MRMSAACEDRADQSPRPDVEQEAEQDTVRGGRVGGKEGGEKREEGARGR